MSAQNKSFIALLLISIFGIVFLFSKNDKLLVYNQNQNSFDQNFQVTKNKNFNEYSLVKPANAFFEPESVIDTSKWNSYKNDTYGFSFIYNPNWKIIDFKKQGEFNVLEIDPGRKYFNFKVFVSPREYYTMDGLPLLDVEINGKKAVSVSDILFGVNHNNNFFTFDLGLSLTQRHEFRAMIKSLKFN